MGLLTHAEKPKIPGSQRRVYRSMFFKASRNIHWAHENRERLRGIIEWYKCVYGRDDTYTQYRAILDNEARLRIHDTYFRTPPKWPICRGAAGQDRRR